MGTRKIDKLFIWLSIIHIMEDEGFILDNVSDGEIVKLMKTLNKKFFIKEIKNKEID